MPQKCKDCGKELKLYDNATPDTLLENRCQDCYIISRNPKILNKNMKD